MYWIKLGLLEVTICEPWCFSHLQMAMSWTIVFLFLTEEGISLFLVRSDQQADSACCSMGTWALSPGVKQPKCKS